MVLDAGNISEFDAPQTLLSKKKGIFYVMAKDAGLADQATEGVVTWTKALGCTSGNGYLAKEVKRNCES